MKKLSSLLLALAGSLACSGANGVPSHIVQPLPRELDPRLEQPLTPPSRRKRQPGGNGNWPLFRPQA